MRGNSRSTRQREDPPSHIGPVSKILQPPVHPPSCQWTGDDDSDQHQPQEIPRQKRDNAGHTGTQHFPDPDLPGTHLCSIGRQPKKTQAGKEDRNGRKSQEKTTCPDIPSVHLLVVLIQEAVVERETGIILLPKPVYRGNRLRRFPAAGLYVEEWPEAGRRR